MGYKKGVSGNPKGRTKGVKNKVTTSTKEVFDAMMQGKMEHVSDVLDILRVENPGLFLKCYTNLLPFFMAKQIETEVTINEAVKPPTWFKDGNPT